MGQQTSTYDRLPLTHRPTSQVDVPGQPVAKDRNQMSALFINEQFPFLDLAAELRVKVYEKVLENEPVFWSKVLFKGPMFHTTSRLTSESKLLLSNKQIAREFYKAILDSTTVYADVVDFDFRHIFDWTATVPKDTPPICRKTIIIDLMVTVLQDPATEGEYRCEWAYDTELHGDPLHLWLEYAHGNNRQRRHFDVKYKILKREGFKRAKDLRSVVVDMPIYMDFVDEDKMAEIKDFIRCLE